MGRGRNNVVQLADYNIVRRRKGLGVTHAMIRQCYSTLCYSTNVSVARGVGINCIVQCGKPLRFSADSRAVFL